VLTVSEMAWDSYCRICSTWRIMWSVEWWRCWWLRILWSSFQELQTPLGAVLRISHMKLARVMESDVW